MVFHVLALFPERLVSRSRLVMPMTPFMGVRISCDMEARNSLLAREAVSASTLARRSRLLGLDAGRDIGRDGDEVFDLARLGCARAGYRRDEGSISGPTWRIGRYRC